MGDMEVEESKKLEASIRYYSDPTNTIHYVDPIIISDFVSVESFDFKKPHTVYQVHGGVRIEVPVQVFDISDNREDLMNPQKRRIFEKKRKSEVFMEIMQSREKEAKKNSKTTGAEADGVMPNQDDVVPTGKSKLSVQEAKAMQKQIKENAKEAVKTTDTTILEAKLQTIKEQKLNYEEDSTILQQHQKRIYDLQEESLKKNQEIADLQLSYGIRVSQLEAEIERMKKFELSQKMAIDRQESSNVVGTPGFREDELHLDREYSYSQPSTSYSTTDFIDALKFDGVSTSKNTTVDRHDVQLLQFDRRKETESVHNTQTETISTLQEVNSECENALLAAPMQEKITNKYKGLDLKMKRKTHVCQKDNDDSASDNLTDRESGIVQKKASGFSKSREKDVSESEVMGKRKKMKLSAKFGTKKYKDMHSSSDSGSESDQSCNSNAIKNKKISKSHKRYSRGSDDEYLSDDLPASDRPDYTSFMVQKGNKQVKMYHLKHNIFIKYAHWDELKKTLDMREYMRILIHAMYKEEDLINKAFKLSACKTERIPGQQRTEFTRSEKAAIRKTFFRKLDLTVTDRQDRKMHRNHWKTYISEHINALVEREKRNLKKQKLLEEAKKAAKEEAAKDVDGAVATSSFSSDDE